LRPPAFFIKQGGVKMQKYFKAKIPFSSGTGIYNPADKEPSKANAKMVDSWIEAGYAVEVEAPIEEPKKEIKTKAPNEPKEPIKTEVIERVAEEAKQPKNTKNESQNDNVEDMTYPQLKKAAKAANIKGYQNMKQIDLIKALKGE
jgi:hypothetical protein